MIVFFSKPGKENQLNNDNLSNLHYTIKMDITSILCGIGFCLFMGYLINRLNKQNQGY